MAAQSPALNSHKEPRATGGQIAGRMIIMLVIVIVAIAALGYRKYMLIQQGIAMGKMMAPPPSAVTTVTVKGQTWQPTLNAVGSLKAVNGVVVSTDMAGIVREIKFDSGAPVKKGDLIVRMDTEQEEAQLHSAEAKRDLARVDLERKKDLIEKKAISSSDWDTANSTLRQSEAAVEEAKAVIARKTIKAPFDGVAGIRMVDLGQYLNTGAAIVSLQSMDPIYVEFSLPQQELAKIATGKKVRVHASGLEGGEAEGEITAIDSRVDDATRNVLVQGTIKNPEGKLRPGMFVNVEVLLPQQDEVLTVPNSAISYAPYGDSVFVVVDSQTPGPDGKTGKEVEQHFVKLGPARGDQVSILSGIKAGDEVVSAGVFRLRPGAPVRINNEVQPGNELNPKPNDT